MEKFEQIIRQRSMSAHGKELEINAVVKVERKFLVTYTLRQQFPDYFYVTVRQCCIASDDRMEWDMIVFEGVED